jgi:hypothetical protein
LASLVYCSSGDPAYWKPSSERCKGAYREPTIWSAAFPNTPRSWFWSSSPYADYSYGAWGVHFDYGYVSYDGFKYNAFYVRLVRGGQAGDPGTSSPPRGATEAATSAESWSDCAKRIEEGDPRHVDDDWGAAGNGKADLVTSECGYYKEVDKEQCDLWYSQEYKDCLEDPSLKFDEASMVISRGFNWYDPDGPVVRSFAYLCNSKEKVTRKEFGRRVCAGKGPTLPAIERRSEGR